MATCRMSRGIHVSIVLGRRGSRGPSARGCGAEQQSGGSAVSYFIFTRHPLAFRLTLGGYRGHRRMSMTADCRRALLPLSLLVAISTTAPAQTAAPAPSGATAAWTLKTKGDIRWQQVTPAGALLVSTHAALAGVDIQRGQALWEKPGPGGRPGRHRRVGEGVPLMEGARPGLVVGVSPRAGAG